MRDAFQKRCAEISIPGVHVRIGRSVTEEGVCRRSKIGARGRPSTVVMAWPSTWRRLLDNTDGFAIEQDRASTAVSGVATDFGAVRPSLAQDAREALFGRVVTETSRSLTCSLTGIVSDGERRWHLQVLHAGVDGAAYEHQARAGEPIGHGRR